MRLVVAFVKGDSIVWSLFGSSLPWRVMTHVADIDDGETTLVEAHERTEGLLERVTALGHAYSLFAWTEDEDYNRARRAALRAKYKQDLAHAVVVREATWVVTLTEAEALRWDKMLGGSGESRSPDQALLRELQGRR